VASSSSAARRGDSLRRIAEPAFSAREAPTDEEADHLVEHLHAEVLRIVRRGGVRRGTPALLFALQKGLRASSRRALIDIVLHHSDELDAVELASALDALDGHLYEDASSDWSSELGSFDTWRGVLAQIAARHPGVEELVQDAWSIDAHVGMLLAPAGFRESMRFTMRQLRQHMIGSPEELRAAVGAARLPIMQTALVPLDDSEDDAGPRPRGPGEHLLVHVPVERGRRGDRVPMAEA
jgi:hypothetical protein